MEKSLTCPKWACTTKRSGPCPSSWTASVWEVTRQFLDWPWEWGKLFGVYRTSLPSRSPDRPRTVSNSFKTSTKTTRCFSSVKAGVIANTFFWWERWRQVFFWPNFGLSPLVFYINFRQICRNLEFCAWVLWGFSWSLSFLHSCVFLEVKKLE